MIYTAASPEDEAQHLQHHERFLEALRYVVRRRLRKMRGSGGGDIQVCSRDGRGQTFVIQREVKVSVKQFQQLSALISLMNVTLFLKAEVVRITASAARILAESLPLPC